MTGAHGGGKSSGAARPYPLVNRIALGLVIALLAVGVPVGCFLHGTDPDPRHFIAISSPGEAAFYVTDLRCVSVDRVTYDGKEFSDPELSDTVAEILGTKTVLFNASQEECPWGLHLGVLSGLDPHIGYNGLFSRFHVSVHMCERTADRRAKPGRCTSKEIYVLTPRVAPHDLFRIALSGLRRPYVSKDELFQVEKYKRHE